MTTSGDIGGELVTARAALAARPRGPQFFGDGLTNCRGCGAALGLFREMDGHVCDAEGRYWQVVCFRSLRCETCGGAKTREWNKTVHCLNCERPSAWVEAWGVVGRQAAMDYIERARRERQWPQAWEALWYALWVNHERRTLTWVGDFVSAWKLIASAHVKWTWWSRKWLKQWGRLGAHHRRRAARFANPAAWGDEDPTVRRFSQLEFD